MDVSRFVRRKLSRLGVQFSRKYPVHVFHHIPECGGTSLRKVLEQWFALVEDYRVGWTTGYGEKVNLRRLRSAHCLCGHFELEGCFLHQRYPAVLESPNFRLITFVREPLRLRLSLYRFEKENRPNEAKSLDKRLFGRANYIARRFAGTLEDYEEALGRYDFIGIIEEGQTAVDLLAQVLRRESHQMPLLNTTGRPRSRSWRNSQTT